jgi:nicotinamide riboside transporter PnuC
MIVYLVYDLWYRAITKKKPYHHPDKWPAGLIVYLILLFIGSIGLNWYGFLVSELYGEMLVAAFFIMMSSFGYYQYRYSKRKKAKEGQVS